jgi:hypothetical protein
MTPGYWNLGHGSWRPDGPPVDPPPRRKRPRWFFPVVGFGTAVVRVVVFLVVAAVVGAHESAQHSAAPPRAQQIQLPVTPDALFAKLTRDIQDKNETSRAASERGWRASEDP